MLQRGFFLIIMLFATSYAFSQVKKKLNQAAVPADFEKEMLKEYIQHMKIKDDTSARKIIKSKAGSFYFAPKYFYIQQIEIFPELKDDSAGFTLQPKSGKMQTLAFEKGTIGFFKNHLDKSIARVDSLYPVTIRIKKLNITEKRTDIIYDDCILKFEYVFECRYKNKTIPLTTQYGDTKMRVILGEKKPYDSLLTETLNYVVPKIDEIMEEAIDKIPDLCKAVNHKITLRNNNGNSDTIFYNGQTPLLSWDDFTGVTANENQFASYAGIFFEPEIEYKKGYLNILTHIGTGFIKKMSSAGDNVRKDEVLRHENYHLKLVYYYTLKLKKQLESLQLTMDNYRDELYKTFEEINNEMKTAVESYSSETRFGLKKKDQQHWEETIQEKLTEISQAQSN